MPQARIDPPRQSHATNEASALPPSHHSWITRIRLTLFRRRKQKKNLSPNNVHSRNFLLKFLFRLPSPEGAHDRSYNSCLICDRLEQSKQTEPGQTSSALSTFDLCLKPGNYLFATLDLIVFEDESLRQSHICQVTVSSTVVQNHLVVIVEIYIYIFFFSWYFS